MKVFALFYLFAFPFISCSSTRSTAEPIIKQGVSGIVTEMLGDQMPSPDRESFAGKGLKTTVFIHEATNINQVERVGLTPFYKSIKTKLVKTVETDEKGNFKIELPEGSYSFFVKVNGLYYSNLFDNKNNISLFNVEHSKVTELNITVSSNATF